MSLVIRAALAAKSGVFGASLVVSRVIVAPHAVCSKISRPISIRRISLVPAPIS